MKPAPRDGLKAVPYQKQLPKKDRELRAASGAIDGDDLPAMQLDEVADDGKAQTGAARIASP